MFMNILFVFNRVSLKWKYYEEISSPRIEQSIEKINTILHEQIYTI